MKADEGARSNGLQGCLLIPEQAEDFISDARRRGRGGGRGGSLPLHLRSRQRERGCLFSISRRLSSSWQPVVGRLLFWGGGRRQGVKVGKVARAGSASGVRPLTPLLGRGEETRS